ncbi:hypothetical protein CL614_00670 [archaeon]|nr:hypothetical protein [archaeon]|tara:strand:+ start:29 stop:223 length:195 start_codon:yes stop_codon:yes gene_type:complete
MRPKTEEDTPDAKKLAYTDFRQAGGMSTSAMQEALAIGTAAHLARTPYAAAGIDARRDIARAQV